MIHKPLTPKLAKPTTVWIDADLMEEVKAALNTKPKKLTLRQAMEHGLRLFLEGQKATEASPSAQTTKSAARSRKQ